MEHTEHRTMASRSFVYSCIECTSIKCVTATIVHPRIGPRGWLGSTSSTDGCCQLAEPCNIDVRSHTSPKRHSRPCASAASKKPLLSFSKKRGSYSCCWSDVDHKQKYLAILSHISTLYMWRLRPIVPSAAEKTNTHTLGHWLYCWGSKRFCSFKPICCSYMHTLMHVQGHTYTHAHTCTSYACRRGASWICSRTYYKARGLCSVSCVMALHFEKP